MLRHFKMEMLKRQQEELLLSQQNENQPQPIVATMPTDATHQLAANINLAADHHHVQPLKQHKQQPSTEQTGKKRESKSGADKAASRSRSRRASKPQMEKRRRARINECLDILKSYVLTDSSNLAHLGIDLAASENQDEETIARTILKSSGLIYRHRGRKNPNKLEKADILELTVDYVRRLHEQRDELLLCSSNGKVVDLKLVQVNENQAHANNNHRQPNQLIVPAHLSEPLTLDLSPKTRFAIQTQQNCCDLLAQGHPHGAPLTPPPSSTSSVQSGGANEEANIVTQQIILSRVLDNYKLYDPYLLPHQQQKC